MNTHARGVMGEMTAESYLLGKGAMILERNYRRREGEIDLIALWEDRVVFVEVKRRDSTQFGTPAEAVTPAKQRTIVRVALHYLRDHGMMEHPIRFDVAEIAGEQCHYIEAAFDATGWYH